MHRLRYIMGPTVEADQTISCSSQSPQSRYGVTGVRDHEDNCRSAKCRTSLWFARCVMTMKKWCLTLTLLVSCAVAQQAPSALQGSWIATAGPNRYLRGRWSAQILPATRNAANGSWTLFNESSQIVLEGTWSGRKSASGWEGTWSARIQKGRTVSGTWNAAMADFHGKTFEDMLKQTAEKQIGGSWRSGRAQGNWWLQR